MTEKTLVKSKKMLLMGNEAIARGAVEAGLQVAAAYPGTPSSEVFATLAHFAKEFGYYAEWSVNEKVALEVAAGAAYAGARAIVTMKQVGLNVAADPLMTLAYIGVKGGLVLVVADDPGPHSSQNEQDTRKFAQFAKLPVFEPATPQEAKDMTVAAFELSEKFGVPVFLRPTTRTCHVCQDVELGEIPPRAKVPGFVKDPSWVIFPSLAYQRHKWLNELQEKIRAVFNESPFNLLEIKSRIGIITSGVSYNYVKEALDAMKLEASLLKIGTPYPLPDAPVREFLGQVDRVLIVEEQEPVVEDQLIALAWKNGITTALSGKHNLVVPREGELDVDKVKNILRSFFAATGKDAATAAAVSDAATSATAAAGTTTPATKTEAIPTPTLPLRAPILCAGCPHRASFYAFKEAAKGTDAVFTGDIGCYTLGVMPPLNAVDTCLCMGASVTIASGLAAVEPGRKHIAFLGDSTFFHTGLAGLINAVYNNADITLVVLDNRTTAMTGHQPHPGLERTATGSNDKHIDIAAVVRALGVSFQREADPYNLPEAAAVAKEALNHKGVSVVVMKRDCVALVKSKKTCRVNPDDCTGCNRCIRQLGCPAIVPAGEKVVIGSSCMGCRVCTQVCPAGAIREVEA